MTFFRYRRGFRLRRVLRGIGLTVGLTLVVALAMVGAVIGLGVLAIGAVVLSLVRAVRRPATVSAASGDTIEGSYRVVTPAPTRQVRRLTVSATNG
jgi:hypothetical protein